MSAKGGFKEKFYNEIAPVVTGIGAAVVILGALFKIQHYPGASIMLIVGLGTEALLFIMFAFAPIHKDPDWSKVYPELAEDFEGEYDEDEYEEEGEAAIDNSNLTGELGNMLAGAGVTQDTINRLGEGLNGLSTNVEKMGSLTNAAAASERYSQSASKATESLDAMSQQYAATAKAMEGMSSAAVDAGEYHTQVQNVTKNLSSLNAVYEMELQDANSHLKAMNKFHTNLSVAMQNMADAGKDTEQFKQELSKLSGNLSQLNKVYGNMLTAMKG
jgi:gliding motility-associated protein GldL